MKINKITALIAVLSVVAPLQHHAQGDCSGVIVPGAKWFDTNGERIHAHSAGVILDQGTYYWYGQDQRLGNFNKTGVSCYSSTDLVTWTNEGVVLPTRETPEVYQYQGVCERPKVLYNAKNENYVMWMHLDGGQYKEAAAGIAVSASPTGPFKFLKEIRPIHYDFGYPEDDRCNQAELGGTYRDMNLFLDDNGEAYVFYSSEDNATMYICRLDEDFTDIQRPAVKGETWSRNFANQFREAPAPFKSGDSYYMITSGCTGWDPNPARYAVADHPLGPWVDLGDPCIGPEANTTFRSQSTCVIPAPNGKEGHFVYLGDRWIRDELEDSRFVWLPFVIGQDRKITIENYPHWTFSVFDEADFDTSIVPQVTTKQYRDDKMEVGLKLTWEAIAGADLYRIYRNGEYKGSTREPIYRNEGFEANRRYTFQVQAATLDGKQTERSKIIHFDTGPAKKSYLSDWTPDAELQDFGKLTSDLSVCGKPLSIAGQIYAKGLGAHANSSASYKLYGMYEQLSALVGVDDGCGGSVVFSVWCDGEERYSSPVMTKGESALPVRVDLTGVNELKLVVSDGGDGIGCDHANWVEAIVE